MADRLHRASNCKELEEDPNFSETSGSLFHESRKKELHVAAQQASFHFACHVRTRKERHFVCVNWPQQKDGQRPSLCQGQCTHRNSLTLLSAWKTAGRQPSKTRGIVMLAKSLQPSKAPSPMAVTDSLKTSGHLRLFVPVLSWFTKIGKKSCTWPPSKPARCLATIRTKHLTNMHVMYAHEKSDISCA